MKRSSSTLMLVSVLLALLCFMPTASAAGVMGIDFGTDWFKVAVVKPGVPLETVLNKDSKRKTEAVISIRDGVRQFGSDAVTVVCKQYVN
jgi:hypoxia up-regulated 1